MFYIMLDRETMKYGKIMQSGSKSREYSQIMMQNHCKSSLATQKNLIFNFQAFLAAKQRKD